MPLKLADLVAKTKRVTVSIDGDSVTLDVRSALITPKLVADLDALQRDDVDPALRMRSLSEQLARLVASWDVLDTDGSMFPLDADRLAAELPIDVQVRLLMEAIKVMQPGEAAAPTA